VYIGPNQIEQNNNLYPDVYLSDVTAAPQLQAISGGGYGTSPSQSMLEALPQAVIDTIKEDAASAGELVNQAGQAASAAASALQSSIITPLLIGAVIVFGLLYLPKGR
jgi:hypothetical protein